LTLQDKKNDIQNFTLHIQWLTDDRLIFKHPFPPPDDPGVEGVDGYAGVPVEG
jgi:hypothetical protein